MTNPKELSEQLLPCPFCGGTASEGLFHYVECDECSASTELHVWNKRLSPTPPDPAEGVEKAVDFESEFNRWYAQQPTGYSERFVAYLAAQEFDKRAIEWMQRTHSTPAPKETKEPPYDEYRALHTPMTANPYSSSERKPSSEELDKLFDSLAPAHREADRFTVIEECASRLDEAASGFIEVGNGHPEGEDRDTAYSMAHIFEMAAEKVRSMDPRNEAAAQRNISKVREWMRALKAGENPEIPSYAYGSYRNVEYQSVRNWLLAAAPPVQSAPESRPIAPDELTRDATKQLTTEALRAGVEADLKILGGGRVEDK